MRRIWFFVCIIGLTVQQLPSQQTCYVSREETVNSLLATDIVGLHMHLYILSRFQPETPADVLNLQKVAREAVFSLASEFSAYGDRFQRCSLPDAEYHQKTGQANRMILLLTETHGLDLLEEAMLPPYWPLRNIPPFVGHLADNPAIRGKKLPLHAVIEGMLQAYARAWQGQPDSADPVQMAALELLGQRQVWDVKKFRAIKFPERNQSNTLYDKDFFYSDKLDEFRTRSVSERLAILADYYLP